MAQQGGFRTDGERVELNVYIGIQRLSDIDLAKETFRCQFELILTWRATEDDERRYQDDRINYQPSFIPMVQFPNGNIGRKEIRKTDGQSYLLLRPGQKDIAGDLQDEEDFKSLYLNQCLFTICGEFHESFELKNFPFDVQDLQITLELIQSCESIIFSPSFNGSDVGFIDLRHLGIAGYEMREPIMELWTSDYSSDTTWSGFTYRMKIVRKWPIYFWRVGLFILFLSMSSMAVFTMDHSDGLSDRFGVLFTLLLAATAFQYTVNSELPNLPYLTLMDVYVLFTFAFVFMVIVFVSVAGYFEVSDEKDILLFFVSSGVFVLFHIIFALNAYRARKYEMGKVKLCRYDYAKHGYNEMLHAKGPQEFWQYDEDIRMDPVSKTKLLECAWWTSEEDWARNN